MTDAIETQLIFHIAEPDQWDPAAETYVPKTFADEGFIHCSIESQIDDVLRKHYPGRSDLTLLTTEPSLIADLVVYEDLYGNGEVFPHIYGHLPTKADIHTRPLENV